MDSSPIFTHCNIIVYFCYLLQTAGEKTVSAFPDGENLFYWVATINGPLDTVRIEVMLDMWFIFILL